MKFKIKRNSYKFKNILVCLAFFFSYYLFFLSLEGCFEGEDFCCMKWKWMKLKILEELLSCFIMVILFDLMILKKISRFHLLHFIIIFISFYQYTHGIEFDDHGYFNIKYYFIILISILIVIVISKLILSIKKKGILVFYIILATIFLFFF